MGLSRLLAALAVLCLLLVATAAVAGHGDRDGKERKGRHAEPAEPKDGDREADRKEAGERDGDHDRDREADGRGDGGNHRDRDRHQAVQPMRRDAGPATEPAPSVTSDASVQVLVTSSPGTVLVTILASRPAGDPAAVGLNAQLPDVGAPWMLETAAAADACHLDGTTLACSLGLAPGEAGLVQASAPVAAPPGWAAEATANVAAPGDAAPGNDAATARLGILLL